MATAAQLTLHPETQRLLDVPAWTADEAVRPWFEAIAALQPIAERLQDMQHARPAISNYAATEIGALSVAHRESGQIHVWNRHIVGTGAVGMLWDALKGLRDAWIDARLESEGLRSDLGFEAWYERREELSDAADTVETAWALFQRGSL